MRTVLIKVSELENFVQSDAFRKAVNIPISRQRARAQAANPRALPDDIALVLVYNEDKLQGYLALLPDHLFIGGQPERVAWISNIWVGAAARGKGVAKLLLKEAGQYWDGRLLATEYTATAKKFYDKSRLFDDLLILKGMRAYLRPNFAWLLSKKNSRFNKINGLLKLLDTLLAWPNRLRLSFYKADLPDGIQIKAVNKIDETTAAFLRSRQKTSLFKRNAIALNWLLQYPWLNNDEQAKEDQERYKFSVFAEDFKFECYQFSKNEEIKAFLILAVRERALKVPYVFCSTKQIPRVAKFIESYMLEHEVDILTSYHPALCKYWSESKSPFFMKRKIVRRYLISKALSGELPSPFFLQDGDGDCAFT